MSKSMVLKPRMSEKAYYVSTTLNTYVFDVPLTANKLTVIDAIETQFKVKVLNVKMVLAKGKPKKSYQKRNRPISGKRVDIKKAYIRLAEGDTIDIFTEKEEAKSKTSKSKAQNTKESK